MDAMTGRSKRIRAFMKKSRWWNRDEKKIMERRVGRQPILSIRLLVQDGTYTSRYLKVSLLESGFRGKVRRDDHKFGFSRVLLGCIGALLRVILFDNTRV